MQKRLSTASPEIALELAGAKASARLAAVRLVALQVARLVPGVPSALFDTTTDATAIAAGLDERYIQLQAQGSVEAEAVFAQARAAAAVGFANEASPDEALYEALIALDNPRKLLALLKEALGAQV
ncbi:hypothetical protein C5F53_06695 [Rhodoferax sp. TS-BS-61-7]|nr:hypothetical protein C5F53_06695 [Rhodoferax sp. TS-BS-61-7]